ncbi:MAG: TRAP transporter substrate-binding protein [Alphaproteobacteria bacterium]|nr:TRAP transporter substrate-binding protein [Alphaproteobacteria bacterium]MCB9929959.1 TRAP transporter substrate-binding protein [Alphaproteobacteria bacterium]
MGIKAILGGALAAAVMITAATGHAEDVRKRWKMHSSFGSQVAILGPAGVRVAKNITELSNGSIRVKFFEPNALVPGIQYFDPISSGSLPAAWGSPGYNMGQEPALAFFSAVPFGPGFAEYNAWVFEGGGVKFLDEIYAKHNIKSLMCGMIPPEASGWFRKEIKSLNDLQGLKMRFFGLGARVMEKVGVSTQLLAGGDIYPALELGSIDATEFSMPSIDESYGFYQIAKHYYFPGWHQPSSYAELAINLDEWNSLSDHQRFVIETVCKANLMEEFTQAEAMQGAALDRMVNEHGVQVHQWSDETLNTLQEKWQEVAGEMSAEDAMFKTVWEHYSAFRKTHKAWRTLGYLK